MAGFLLLLFPPHLAYYSKVDNVAQFLALHSDPSEPSEAAPCVVCIKPHLILDPLQVAYAASRARMAASQKKMKTKNLRSELLYNLSHCNHINTSMQTWGVQPTDSSLLLAVFGTGGQMKEVSAGVKGTTQPLTSLATDCHRDELIKLYKLKEKQLNFDSGKPTNLLDAVVCYVASKGIVKGLKQ